MAKPRITADILLQIVKGVFKANDYKIEDQKSKFFDKTINEVLNVNFYTFKRRLTNKRNYIEQFKESLRTAFCLFELNPNLNITFSNKLFMATPSATMTFFIPTSKVPILDDFIGYCNSELNGESFTATISGEAKKVKLFFSAMTEVEVQKDTIIGEASICTIGVSFIISDDIASMSDYKFEIGTLTNNQDVKFYPIFPNTFGGDKTMTPKATPYVNQKGSTAQINLSNARVISLSFYGLNSPLIDEFYNMAMDDEETPIDNNKPYFLKITRRGEAKVFKTVLSSIKLNVEDNTGYENYVATFVKRGKK